MRAAKVREASPFRSYLSGVKKKKKERKRERMRGKRLRFKENKKPRVIFLLFFILYNTTNFYNT